MLMTRFAEHDSPDTVRDSQMSRRELLATIGSRRLIFRKLLELWHIIH